MTSILRPSASKRAFQAAAAGLSLSIALTALASLRLLAGCSDDQRRGKVGDSCLTTNDCESPSSCVANVCGGPIDAGADVIVGDGPSADAGPWSVCDDCLDKECASELAACGPSCIGVEACLEVLCTNLSEIGSDEEGDCQTTCQSQNPGGSAPHIAVVNCAIDADCRPPCVIYPQDYDSCRAFMNSGDCAGAHATCENSVDCITFRSCVATCTTLAECLNCSNSTEGLAGKKLLEAYEQCIALECISESWLIDAL